MSEELNRINPTVVEGAEDIHGAEGHEAEMYSPMMQNKFAFRDAMRRSRDTLTEKQVGDLMRMRRFGRGAYGAEGLDAEMNERTMELLKRFANSPAGKMKNKSTGFSELDKMIDKKAKKISKSLKGAESKFDELSDEIAEQYEKKGMSKEEAEKIGDATAYKVGVAKFGKKGMEKKAKAGMDKKKMKADSFESEALGRIVGNVIPEPQFMGIEELVMERGKNQNMKDAQGYDDKLDESMGMSMRESKMEQSMKDRRDESKGMEKGMGRRAYQRVKTMDKDSESFEANEEAVEQTDANMVNEGSVDAFYGSGAKVDTSSIELQPISNPSVDEAFDVGNDVGIDVAEQEVMNVNPSVEVNYGAETDIVDTTQDLLAKGGVRVGGMTASALVIAIAGLSGYYFAKR